MSSESISAIRDMENILDKRCVINRSRDMRKISDAEEVVRNVISNDIDLFGVIKKGRTKKARIERTPLGIELEQKIREIRRVGLKRSSNNPYVKLLVTAVKSSENIWGRFLKKGVSDTVHYGMFLQDVVNQLRFISEEDDFVECVKASGLAVSKRISSVYDFEEALFRRYARLLVVRVDLSYRQFLFYYSKQLQYRLECIRLHWRQFRHDLSKGVPVADVLGYCARLEYRNDKGFHFHVALFFDGAKHCRDVFIGHAIGNHWIKNIVGEDGLYHNCNACKDEYPRLGIGVINHSDHELRKNLRESVLSYLTHHDGMMSALAPGERTFFRSNLPKIDIRKLGRPRNGAIDSEEVLLDC